MEIVKQKFCVGGIFKAVSVYALVGKLPQTKTTF